jgi:hypothetical protein
MTVPAYYRSRRGRVFRVQRAKTELPEGRMLYRLRAVPIRPTPPSGVDGAREVEQEVSAAAVLEKLRLGQAIAVPEATFEQLWQQLRVELDAA